MTTPTDSRPDLLTVVTSMRAKPGMEKGLRETLEGLVQPTKQEAGCVNYDLHQSVSDPAVFYFYENWETPEHLDAHMGTPHIQQALGRVDELLDGALIIERLRRIG